MSLKHDLMLDIAVQPHHELTCDHIRALHKTILATTTKVLCFMTNFCSCSISIVDETPLMILHVYTCIVHVHVLYKAKEKATS